MPTHYDVLGIPEGASPEAVRQAYRRLVKASHPDRAGDPARFRRVTQAYGVLSDPVRRAAYDRTLRPAPVTAPPRERGARRPRRRYGRYAALVVLALAAAGVAGLASSPARQSLGDDCLVGTWRGEALEVGFRGFLDGREVVATVRGGAGVTLTVDAGGRVRTDYAEAAPLVGATGAYWVEVAYEGATTERWRADGERVSQRAPASPGLELRATINGRPPDQPIQATVLDADYPYRCTPTALEIGPYRYGRV